MPAGSVHGRQAQRDFHLGRCSACGYARVVDPVEDLGEVYSMDYYEGRGADPLVDYMTELDAPESTIRNYEWNGVLRAVSALTDVTPATRWLDFGCGNGGLVRYLEREVGCDVVGWDEGAIVDVARARGIPIVDDADLEVLGPFDVITAVEVLEHVPDPARTMERIAGLLAPGGLFFYTTGNAQPFRERLSTWSYVIPEIHISFYEPRTMHHLLAGAGLDAVVPGWHGWSEIYRFKLLKNLRRRHRNIVTDHLPAGPAAHVFERRLGLAAFPPGRKPAA